MALGPDDDGKGMDMFTDDMDTGDAEETRDTVTD